MVVMVDGGVVESFRLGILDGFQSQASAGAKWRCDNEIVPSSRRAFCDVRLALALALAL